MSALAELDTAPQTIEPTVNYIVNDGAEVFNYTGGPGSTEVKTGGTPDPHKVVDAQRAARTSDEFKLDVDGFRFVAPRHQDAELLRRGRDQARLLPGDGGADQSRERRQARRGVRPHAAHRRRRAPRGAARSARSVRRAHNDYTEWSGPQRVRDILPRRGRGAAQAPLRHHPGVAADPPSGRDASARHLPTPAASRPTTSCCRSAAIPTGSARPMRSPTTPKHKWFWFPRQARDEALVFKVYDSAKDGRARWTAHTAFDDPTTPPNARPRESIEIRTLAFF